MLNCTGFRRNTIPSVKVLDTWNLEIRVLVHYHYLITFQVLHGQNSYFIIFVYFAEVESRPSSISAETWQLISQEKTQVDDQSEFDKNIDDSVMFSSVSDTEYSSSRNSQIPVLPEINRSGSLIAQWNNERPFSGNSRNSSVLTIRNSLNVANVSDSLEIMSIGTESVSSTPRPPSGDKPSNLSQRAKMERNVIQSS